MAKLTRRYRTNKPRRRRITILILSNKKRKIFKVLHFKFKRKEFSTTSIFFEFLKQNSDKKLIW